MHVSTGAYEFLASLTFNAQCLSVKGGWIAVGGNSEGQCAFIQVTQSGYRALPASRRSAVANARRKEHGWDGNFSPESITDGLFSTPPGAIHIGEHQNPISGFPAFASYNSRLQPPLSHSEEAICEPDFIEKFGGSIINGVSVDRLPAKDHAHTGETIVLLANNDTSMTIYSITRKEIINSTVHPTCINLAVLSPDKKTIVVIGDSPFVYFYNISANTSTANRLRARNALYPFHNWNFEIFATAVIDLDPGISGVDACLFAAAFNQSSNLLAIGAQDGSVTVIDLPAFRERYLLKNCAATPVKIEDQLIHTFKSSRNASQGGAVRYLEFSPAPLDLLVWIEDTDYFGVADVRATFRRRQIVRVNPESRNHQKIDPFEIGLTTRRRTTGWPPSTSNAPVGSHLDILDDHDDNAEMEDEDEQQDDDFDDNDDDDSFDDNYGRGSGCNCRPTSNNTESAPPAYLHNESAMVCPAVRVWRDLSRERDLRRRRAMFYERSSPEDVEQWGIEHWRSGTNHAIYLAREADSQQYWRNINRYPRIFESFWMTVRQRDRTLQYSGSNLELAAHPTLVSQIANRPPPLHVYIHLRRSGHLCRHGMSDTGARAIRDWQARFEERRQLARRAIVPFTWNDDPQIDILDFITENLSSPLRQARIVNNASLRRHGQYTRSFRHEPRRPQTPILGSSRRRERQQPNRISAGQYGVDMSVTTRLTADEITDLHWSRLREQIRVVIERLARNQREGAENTQNQSDLYMRLSLLHTLERMWRRRGRGNSRGWVDQYGSVPPIDHRPPPASLPSLRSSEAHGSFPSGFSTLERPESSRAQADILPVIETSIEPNAPVPNEGLPRSVRQALARTTSSMNSPLGHAREGTSNSSRPARRSQRPTPHRVTIAQPPTTETRTVNGNSLLPSTPPPRPIPDSGNAVRRSSLRNSSEHTHEQRINAASVDRSTASIVRNIAGELDEQDEYQEAIELLAILPSEMRRILTRVYDSTVERGGNAPALIADTLEHMLSLDYINATELQRVIGVFRRRANRTVVDTDQRTEPRRHGHRTANGIGGTHVDGDARTRMTGPVTPPARNDTNSDEISVGWLSAALAAPVQNSIIGESASVFERLGAGRFRAHVHDGGPEEEGPHQLSGAGWMSDGSL